jgi:hypothetical protein
MIPECFQSATYAWKNSDRGQVDYDANPGLALFRRPVPAYQPFSTKKIGGRVFVENARLLSLG